MKCNNCGSEMDSNAKFCTNCGKSVEIETQTETTEPQPAPQTETVATYVNDGQPPKKKTNVALIVILVVVGALVVLGVVGAILVKVIFSRISGEFGKLNTPSIDDVINDSNTNIDNDGEIVKTKKDPKGHEVVIKADSIYIYKVETHYIYDEAIERAKNIKKATPGDIERLDATKEQKEAINIILNKITNTIVITTKQEIIDALKKEKYDDKTIEFALENCGVDWQEQANIKAMTVLAAGGYSRKEVKDLMEYEGYEAAEIEKALDQDFDYYEQAAYDACFLRYTSPKYGTVYDRDGAKRLLEFSEYSKDEIDFALKLIYDEMK